MLTQEVTIWTAVIAGLVSFFSPCVLPMIPIYIGYMTGSMAEVQDSGHRRLALRHAALFVLGFSLTFVVLGAVAGAFGRLISPALPVIMRVAGVILMLFGLQMLGLLRLNLLSADRHLNLGRGQHGLLRSLLMGLAFAIGWSPCVGAPLAAILSMAANTQTAWVGALLLGVYSLGFGLPFMAAGLLVGQLRTLVSRAGRLLAITTKVGGVLVLVIGLLMAAGRTDWLTAGQSLF